MGETTLSSVTPVRVTATQSPEPDTAACALRVQWCDPARALPLLTAQVSFFTCLIMVLFKSNDLLYLRARLLYHIVIFVFFCPILKLKLA